MGAEVRTSDVQKGDDSIVRYVQARALQDDGATDAAREIFDGSRRLQPLRLRLDAASSGLAGRPRARGRPAPRRRPRAGRVRLRAVAARPRARRPRDRAPARLRRGAGASPRSGRDRLLPARSQELLGDALPPPARARLGVGRGARRHRDRPDPVPGRRGLALRRGRPRRRAADHRTARRTRARHAGERRVEPVRAVRASGALPLPGPRAVDPCGAIGHGPRGPRRRSARLRDGRRRRDVVRSAHRADPVPAAARGQPAVGDRRVGRRRAGFGARACPRARPPTSCAAVRRAPGGRPRTGRPARSRPRRATTSTRSCAACSISTAAISPSRALPAPARPTSGRTSSPAWSATTAIASASSRSRTPWSRTCSIASSRPASRPAQVAKAPKDASTTDVSFTVIPKNGVASFVAEQTGGFVLGGTAWDFSHEGRVPRGSLDLLVIDEAGQFSLASTIAVSLAAPRLLLLGDPQQLPQVSQGTHPEPVDTSALGLGHGRRGRRAARVRLLPRSHLAHAPCRRRPRVAAVVPRRARVAPFRGAPIARRHRTGSPRSARAPPRQRHPIA